MTDKATMEVPATFAGTISALARPAEPQSKIQRRRVRSGSPARQRAPARREPPRPNKRRLEEGRPAAGTRESGACGGEEAGQRPRAHRTPPARRPRRWRCRRRHRCGIWPRKLGHRPRPLHGTDPRVQHLTRRSVSRKSIVVHPSLHRYSKSIPNMASPAARSS